VTGLAMPDERPALFHVTRRAFAAGAAVSLLLSACRKGTADDINTPHPDASPDPAFLHLSRALTGYSDLDATTAARISFGFGQIFPDLKAHFPALAAMTAKHTQPTDLLAAATQAGLAEPALAIVAAWYKGTVGQGQSAITVAYADALMNRPVSDALYPPTYELGGPGWWTAEPPPIGVSAPVERPAVQAPPRSPN
jgi:hypothetical protein